MSHIMSKKPSAMQWWLLVLVLMLTGGVLVCGAALWQSRSKAQAQQTQQELELSAQRRREGWIELEQQWYAPRNDISTVLLVGVDEMGPLEDSGSYNNNSQADFLLLAVTDHRDKTMTALHLNRDSMTQIPVLGVTGQPAGTITGQLALAHTYGSGLDDSFRNTVKAVSTLLGGITIHNYIGMSMGAVPLINDLLGGVTLTVLDDFSHLDAEMVQGAQCTLTGEQALSYLRIRKGLEDSSNVRRMQRQQQYIQALLEQLHRQGAQSLPSLEQLGALSGYLMTDFQLSELQQLSRQQKEPYRFLGVQQIAGEAKQGEEYMEFYPDAQALQRQVLNLFYEKQ